MSGGHFEYSQYKITEIADSIQHEIDTNKSAVEMWNYSHDDYKVPYKQGDSTLIYRSWKTGEKYRIPSKNIVNDTVLWYGDIDGVPQFDKPKEYHKYSPRVIALFKKAVKKLREAEIYAQRVDYYLSGDDGEDSMFSRLKDDLKKLNPNV